MPPDPPSIPNSPDSADRLLDEMMSFLRGGPVPDPPDPDAGAADPPADHPGTASWDAGRETADPAGRATPAPAEGDTDPGRVIGPYRITADVDRGGMGEVFQARHQEIGRVVALKTIRAGLDGRAGMRQRFRTEAAAVARLDHPHIVRLYDFGEDAGQLYYAMEWAPGGNLARRIRAGALPAREAAGLVRDLARAVAFAHQNKVLHRDLKPNNVLLAADGRVKVADFGLARLLDDPATRVTSVDDLIGTPAYMAPEQAAGRVDDVDARTDVYALGAVLYETVTGSPPFTGRTNLEVLDRVKRETPPPPSSLTPGLSAELEAVCLRCLEKDRAARYPTADALAADLDRFLANEPTEARPPTRLGRAREIIRRRAGVVTLVGLLAVGAAAAAYLTPVPQLEPTAAERLAADRARLARQLDAGGPVEIVPTTGPPAITPIVRWGADRTQLSVAEDGTFRVSSWASALVELVPDPRHDKYKLRARVRHEESNYAGQVGVYVSDRPFPGPAAVGNGWEAVVLFNDVYSAAQTAASREALQHLVPKLVKQPNLVQLGVYGRGEATGGKPWEPRSHIAAGAQFAPRGKLPAGWRNLEVVVTPTGLTATFDGQPVGSLTADAIAETVRGTMAHAAPRFPNPCWAACEPRFDARGGLGLFVQQGTAAFRDVVIEPLDLTP